MAENWTRTLRQAFLSIGVIYGDIATSPMYVFSSTFEDKKIRHKDDILGVTFLIIYTITLVPMIKYVCIISGSGIYNLFKHDVGVLWSFNPMYIIYYFKRNDKQEWVSLGGVVLCVTGTEAMFADLGKFSIPAVQISFSSVVFPSLLIAYVGQAAYIYRFPDQIDNALYASIPKPLYWPTFVMANVAAIIASNAMVSTAFSTISQFQSLSCSRKLKVVHTSANHEGKVYIPVINYILMVACVIVTYSFKMTEKIRNAYGIAVVAVMLITTCLVPLIMLLIWKTKIWRIFFFSIVFMLIDIIYFSSVLYKIKKGGYLLIYSGKQNMAISIEYT